MSIYECVMNLIVQCYKFFSFFFLFFWARSPRHENLLKLMPDSISEETEFFQPNLSPATSQAVNDFHPITWEMMIRTLMFLVLSFHHNLDLFFLLGNCRGFPPSLLNWTLVRWNEDERPPCGVIRLSPAVGSRIHLLLATRCSTNSGWHKSQLGPSQLSFPLSHWEPKFSPQEPWAQVTISPAWDVFTMAVCVCGKRKL